VTSVAPNEATVRVRNGPLVGAVLGRVVGMLAARAECPIDRLDDALLLTDAVAAHAPAHALDGRVTVLVRAAEDGLELFVGPLQPRGAQNLLTDAALPGVGNVFEQVADTVETAAAPDGSGEQLVIRLGFART
jgi:serine/threonine-protein kinase RsbW